MRFAARQLLPPAAYLACGVAHAAGGHHSVDDAAILDPGQCQVETWAEFARADPRTLLHVGTGCRSGPVEWGLGVDRTRTEGDMQSVSGAQLKWARDITPTLSVGLLAAVTALPGRPHNTVATLVLPVTWQASEALSVHLDLGRDRPEGRPSTTHAGMALEAAVSPDWSFVGERFREGGADAWRVGSRWRVSPQVNLDLSRAQGVGNGASAWWTLGVSWVFDR